LLAWPPREARAEAFSAPVVVQQPPAVWPSQPGTHDVIVPVVLVVAPSGAVASVEVEASLDADRRVLAAAPHRTASDLLLTVPGIALTQHSGEGAAHQIFFRGFDAVHGQDLEIWAAGAPVNDLSNVHGQGYADLHFLPPELVKQVRSAPGTYDPRQGDFSVAAVCGSN
jgi:hypothetical protein